MSIPVTQRAADIIEGDGVGSCHACGSEIHLQHFYALAIAEALAAAGLLTDPTTDGLTPEQADVIEAAKALAPHARFRGTGWHPKLHALAAAVDRLTATTEAAS